jgi:hypothetical protein
MADNHRKQNNLAEVQFGEPKFDSMGIGKKIAAGR